jgi:NitT/TauT family transport system substrate-binding protein
MKNRFSPRRTWFDYAHHGLRACSSEVYLFKPFVAVVLFVVNVFFFSSLDYAQAVDKIRIGMGAFSPTNSAIWVAEERGFFKKHGLDVEAIFIGGGAARGINALLAGDIQFASASGGPVVSSMLKGSDVIMIAALNNKGVHRLIVRPDIDSPEALKGKRIAITAFGTASHTVLTLLLNHWNLRQEELNVLQIGSSPTMLVSLQKKIVDGAVLTDPSYFIAEDTGFRVLADLAKMNIHYLQSMLVSTRGYLRGNRDQATRLMRAYVEAIAYFKRNKKESIRIILKKMRMEADKEKYAERTYDQYANTYFDRVPYPSLGGIRTVLDSIARDFPKAKSADPASFSDPSILKSIEDSGFIKSLYE